MTEDELTLVVRDAINKWRVAWARGMSHDELARMIARELLARADRLFA